MIRRPLNTRFTQAVIQGRKITTLREKAWPVGVPIMLYNWSGAAYRSPQIEVAAIVVESTEPVTIRHREDGLVLVLSAQKVAIPNLWQREGFHDCEDFSDWFRQIVQPGQVIRRHLMHFRLL